VKNPTHSEEHHANSHQQREKAKNEPDAETQPSPAKGVDLNELRIRGVIEDRYLCPYRIKGRI
jgi:hypothetical protein